MFQVLFTTRNKKIFLLNKALCLSLYNIATYLLLYKKDKVAKKKLPFQIKYHVYTTELHLWCFVGKINVISNVERKTFVALTWTDEEQLSSYLLFLVYLCLCLKYKKKYH